MYSTWNFWKRQLTEFAVVVVRNRDEKNCSEVATRPLIHADREKTFVMVSHARREWMAASRLDAPFSFRSCPATARLRAVAPSKSFTHSDWSRVLTPAAYAPSLSFPPSFSIWSMSHSYDRSMYISAGFNEQILKNAIQLLPSSHPMAIYSRQGDYRVQLDVSIHT